MEKTDIGLHVVNNFLRPEDEEKLLKSIKKREWTETRTKKRRVQVYGRKHDLKYRPTDDYTKYPCFVKIIIKLLRELRDNNEDAKEYLTYDFMKKIADPRKSELFVNEYSKGDSLGFHFDHRATYGKVIIGISLCSDTEIIFSRGKKRIPVKVPRYSIYFMTGDSRYKYKHGISHTPDYRISLTFRTIEEE